MSVTQMKDYEEHLECLKLVQSAIDAMEQDSSLYIEPDSLHLYNILEVAFSYPWTERKLIKDDEMGWALNKIQLCKLYDVSEMLKKHGHFVEASSW